jgi:hypothetical protein
MIRRLQVVRPAVEELELRRVPAVTFAAQQTFATGANPTGVTAADFNADSRPDLVVANQSGNTVSVFVDVTASGATSAAFAAPQTFAVGNDPRDVAEADFNGDGRPDLVVVNRADNTVSVLLNTTAPGSAAVSFATPQTFAVGTQPYAVEVGDFNGDGRPDLAVANFGSGTVSVLLNTTAPGSAAVSFAAQQTFAAGNAPYDVVVADFNGDGRADIAVVNGLNNTVSVLLDTTTAGATAASFTAPQTFAVDSSPVFVTAADLNGDGRPDLAVANGGSNTVSVLLNTTAPGSGSVSFASHQTFATGNGPTGITSADLDGDGRADLAVADYYGNTLSVLVNTTAAGSKTASFAAGQSFAVGSFPYDVVAADFNGDGRPDLAIVNSQSSNPSTVSVLGNTTAAFAGTVSVVGQFGGAGVWEFNRFLNTWVQLTAANASRLAADPRGDVAGDFPGYGVWLYRPTTGWRQINGVDATLLAMDPLGDLTAEFPGYGVGEFLPASGWRSLTGANASLLAMDAQGDVAAEFPGYGVWMFHPAAGWKQIDGTDAALLAISPQGDVVADFQGYSVAEYLPASGWRLLNGTQASALAIVAQGNVAADFQGYGVGEYLPASGWRLLTAADASLLVADGLGSVDGEFVGYGVWQYDPYRGWHQLTAADATLIAVA